MISIEVKINDACVFYAEAVFGFREPVTTCYLSFHHKVRLKGTVIIGIRCQLPLLPLPADMLDPLLAHVLPPFFFFAVPFVVFICIKITAAGVR